MAATCRGRVSRGRGPCSPPPPSLPSLNCCSLQGVQALASAPGFVGHREEGPWPPCTCSGPCRTGIEGWVKLGSPAGLSQDCLASFRGLLIFPRVPGLELGSPHCHFCHASVSSLACPGVQTTLSTCPDLCSFCTLCLPHSVPTQMLCQRIVSVPHRRRWGPSNQPQPSPVYQCQDVKHSGHVRVAVARAPLQVLQSLTT